MNKSITCKVGSLVLFAFIILLSLPALAQNRNTGNNELSEEARVCVYENAGFAGPSNCWYIGQRIPDLRQVYGNWNDRISSIRVYGRAKIIIWSAVNFQGESLEVRVDQTDLTTLPLSGSGTWNDQISALQVLDDPEPKPSRRRVGPEITPTPAPVSGLRNLTSLNTAARGRGNLNEQNVGDQVISRVSLNLKRGGEAEIEIEGEMPATMLRGRWNAGPGETIDLALTQYKNSSLNGVGKVILSNGAFKRLELSSNYTGSQFNGSFDVRTITSGPTGNPVPAPTPADPHVIAAGRYQIQIVTSGHVLDLRLEDKRSLQQWSGSGGRNQQWDIESAGNGYYYIRSAENGQVLSVDNRARDGVTVFTSPLDKSKDSQKWQFKYADNGQHYLLSKKGVALELPGGVKDLGTRLQVWELSNRETQKFKLVAVGSNTQPVTPVVPVAPGLPEGPGSMTWRGTVDDVIRLEVRGATVTETAVSGSSYTRSSFQFTAALPRRPVTVTVSRQSGRGTVEIVQQPTEFNNYTAVVQLRDSKGGGDTYGIVLSWR